MRTGTLGGKGRKSALPGQHLGLVPLGTLSRHPIVDVWASPAPVLLAGTCHTHKQDLQVPEREEVSAGTGAGSRECAPDRLQQRGPRVGH